MGKRTYSSAMSYTGITRRMTAWARRFGGTETWKKITGWTLVVLGLGLAWALVTMWYVLVFGVLWIVAIPYRMIRRSQRRTVHLQEQQLETLQRLEAQQRENPRP